MTEKTGKRIIADNNIDIPEVSLDTPADIQRENTETTPSLAL